MTAKGGEMKAFRDIFPEPTPEEEAEMTRDAELLDAFGEFTDRLVTGRQPDVDAFLSDYPQFADRLRPEMEFARCFFNRVQRVKRDFPQVDLLDVLLPDIDDDLREKIRAARKLR
jgi:hypothetical protein